MQHEMSRSQAEIDLITAEKAKRVAIFDDTLRFFTQHSVARMRSVSETNFARWEAKAKDRRQHMPPGANNKWGIYCEETDGLRVASLLTQLYGQKVAVLNFANANCFGGGVRGGAGAQEENMFRRTDCYYSRKPNETGLTTCTCRLTRSCSMPCMAECIWTRTNTEFVCATKRRNCRATWAIAFWHRVRFLLLLNCERRQRTSE